MNVEKILALVPFLLALITSVAIALVISGRRNLPGRNVFVAFAFNQATWMFFYIFEIIAPGIEQKMFWDNLQWIPSLLFPILMYIFSYEYTGRTPPHFRWTIAALFIFPVIYIILAFTYRL